MKRVSMDIASKRRELELQVEISHENLLKAQAAVELAHVNLQLLEIEEGPEDKSVQESFQNSVVQYPGIVSKDRQTYTMQLAKVSHTAINDINSKTLATQSDRLIKPEKRSGKHSLQKGLQYPAAVKKDSHRDIKHHTEAIYEVDEMSSTSMEQAARPYQLIKPEITNMENALVEYRKPENEHSQIDMKHFVGAVVAAAIKANSTSIVQATQLELIKTRHSNTDNIFLRELEKVRKMSKVSDSTNDVFDFACDVCSTITVVRALEMECYLHSFEMLSCIVNKMSAITKYRWYDFAFVNGTEPDLIVMEKFLKREIDICARYVDYEALSKKRQTAHRGRHRKNTRRNVNRCETVHQIGYMREV